MYDNMKHIFFSTASSPGFKLKKKRMRTNIFVIDVNVIHIWALQERKKHTHSQRNDRGNNLRL